jgi:hypothetical protein
VSGQLRVKLQFIEDLDQLDFLRLVKLDVALGRGERGSLGLPLDPLGQLKCDRVVLATTDSQLLVVEANVDEGHRILILRFLAGSLGSASAALVSSRGEGRFSK